MGRARVTAKSSQGKLLTKNIGFPADLWAEVERRVPPRERAAFVRRAVQRELGASPIEETPAEASADTGASILAIVEEVWGNVPDEEMKKLPSDLSANLDHYLYGAPKRS
jgi:hypothetical protein